MLYLDAVKPLSKIKNVKLFWCSYAGITLIIGLVSLLWCIIYKLILLEIPSSQFMFQLGELSYAILISVVASVIFYFIVSYLPEYKKKQEASMQIEFWLNQIVSHGVFALNALSGVFTSDVVEISKKNWKEITTKNLKPVDGINVSNVYYYQDWFEFFDELFAQEDHCIGKLEKYNQYLPIELILAFDRLETMDGLRNAVRQYKSFYGIEIVPGFKYDNMSGFENVLWNHIENMRNILAVYQEHKI